MSNIVKTNDPNWALKQEQNGARVVVPTNPEQFNAYQATRRAVKKQKDTATQLQATVDKMNKELDEMKKMLNQLLTAAKQQKRI